jgi:hypothetical protein
MRKAILTLLLIGFFLTVLPIGSTTTAEADYYSCMAPPYSCWDCAGVPWRQFCRPVWGMVAFCDCIDEAGCWVAGEYCVAIIVP